MSLSIPTIYQDTVERLASQFAATAVERDKRGGHAKEEREALRASGLLKLAVPVEYGGPGERWSVIFAILRRLAEVDSSLAHLFGFHNLQVASVICFGSESQRQLYLRGTVEKNWFWGNALSPLVSECDVIENDDHLVFSDTKRFCSGALGSDMLTVAVRIGENKKRLMAVVPTNREGITVHEDWDNMGQRQTDSGSVTFNRVIIRREEILPRPPAADNVFAGLRNCVSQLILTNLYLGIGLGAIAEGRRYTLTHSRTWLAAGVESLNRDPYVLQRYGNLWLQLRAATTLTDAVLADLDRAWARGETLSLEEHGRLVIAISEAKVFNARVGLDVAEQIFDATGARATASKFGLDRFWRNVRTHTLHDPLDYKVRDIGNWALNGELPAVFL